MKAKNGLKRFFGCLLAVMAIFAIGSLTGVRDFISITASAISFPAYFEVTKDQAVVRNGPGQEYKTTGKVSIGKRISVHGSAKSKQGNTFYKIKNSKGDVRYIYSENVAYRGSVDTGYNKKMVVINCGEELKFWNNPYSDNLSKYTSRVYPGYGYGSTFIASYKIQRDDVTWYKVKDKNVFVNSKHVRVHTSCKWDSGRVTKAATCTAKGEKTYNCTLCTATKTSSTSALGHTFGNGCGWCTRCGYWNVKSASSVNNEKYVVIADATKVHDGPYGACSTVATLPKKAVIYVTQKVKNGQDNIWYKYSGGYVFEDYVKKHTSCKWDGGRVTKAATCTAKGEKTYNCTLCTAVKTSFTSALGHTFGNGSGWCTRCGYWNVKSASSVNNEKYVVIADATKVHDGPYGACATVATLSKKTVIYVTQKVKNGQDNIWYKYSGGYVFEDYVKKHTSCTWDSGRVTKAATCTAKGEKTYNCTLCTARKTSSTPALGHTFGKGSGWCTRCGYWNVKSASSVNNEKYVVIADATKVHDGPYGACATVATLSKKTVIYVTQKVKNGQDNIWYKYSGGYVFEDYVKKHTSCTWNSGRVTKAATCTAKGERTYSCTQCTARKTSSTPALGHTFGKGSGWCTRCGYWNVKSASPVNNEKYIVIADSAKVRSGPYSACATVATLSKKTVIYVTQKVKNGQDNIWYKYSGGYVFEDNVKKHTSCTWNSGRVTKAATCTAKGERTYSCTQCTARKIVAIKALGHTYTGIGYCNRCAHWDVNSTESVSYKYTIKTSGATVHKAPYSESPTVSALSKGRTVTISNEIVNGEGEVWYQISQGYIWSDCVYPGVFSTSLNKNTVSLYKGAKTRLKVTVNGPSTQVRWSSSDSSIATVSSSGVVNAIKKGKCKITVEANGIKAVCTINVMNPKITLDAASKTIYKGMSTPFKASVEGPSKKVKWLSSDTSVATVSASGVVTGIKKGSCTITAEANGVKAKCKVRVANPAISLNIKQCNLFSGESKKLVATVWGKSKKVKWSSSNSSVVSVDNNGKFTVSNSKSADGKTCIITAAANGVKATCTVKVSYVKVISRIKSFDRLNDTIRLDTTTKVFECLCDGSISAMQEGSNYYYQFKKGNEAVRVNVNAFMSNCNNSYVSVNKALTDSLNAQISSGNSKSTRVIYPLYVSRNKTVGKYSGSPSSRNELQYEPYNIYDTNISCFSTYATLSGTKIVLKSSKYEKNDKTISFRFVDKIQRKEPGLSGFEEISIENVSTTDPYSYGLALRRYFSSNEKYTPVYEANICNTGSLPLFLQQYNIKCFGYLKDSKGKTLEDFVKIVFDVKDIVGIIAAPQVDAWKSLKTVYSTLTDIYSLIGSNKLSEETYKFNGENKLLSWDYDPAQKEKTVYAHSARFTSPVKLISKSSYYEVDIDLNREPPKDAKMSLKFSVSK